MLKTHFMMIIKRYYSIIDKLKVYTITNILYDLVNFLLEIK